MAGAHEVDEWLRSLSKEEREREIERMREEKPRALETATRKELESIINELQSWLQRKFGHPERQNNQ